MCCGGWAEGAGEGCSDGRDSITIFDEGVVVAEAEGVEQDDGAEEVLLVAVAS